MIMNNEGKSNFTLESSLFVSYLYPKKQKRLIISRLSSALRTRGGNRTRTLLPELDFESSASTNSATRAFYVGGVYLPIAIGTATRAFLFAENWCAKLSISPESAKHYAEICFRLSNLFTTAP